MFTNDIVSFEQLSPDLAHAVVLLAGLEFEFQGPVVQSIISLTGSLRVISLTASADSIYNILIFFADKM